VRLGSGHRGGWRYQLLAAFLTYTAICSAYAFVVYHSMTQPTVEDVIGLVLIAYGIPFLGGRAKTSSASSSSASVCIRLGK